MIFPRTFFILLAAWLGVFGAVTRAETKATAALSQTTIAPGDTISLTIEVSGAQQINPPQNIEAEGLDIRYNGYRQSTQIINGRVDERDADLRGVRQRAGRVHHPGDRG